MLTGRKSKFSPQMQAALCTWLKKGCSYKDACAMEGITYETFRIWEKEKSVFSVAIKKTEAECMAARIQTILKASDKSWQAAAWWLERRCPDGYGCTVKEEKLLNVVTIEELDEDGRQVGSLLERIRNHHREHGHLGKRYAEVIRLFDPSFEYGRKYEWQREADFALSA